MSYLLKFGGNAISGREDMARLSREIAGLVRDGKSIVLVHGGGPEINAELERRGIKPEKVAGVRITDVRTMKVVEEVLSSINRDMVGALIEAGVGAVGLAAKDVTVCVKKGPAEIREDGRVRMADLGRVGDVVSVDLEKIDSLLSAGKVPVIYPVGADCDGNALNVNADTMAAGIAAGMKVEEMIQITDVPGILLDIRDPSTKQSVLTLAEVDVLTEKGIISGGMVPKVEACRRALEAGVSRVRMVNGKDKGSIVSEALRGSDHGTLIIR
ncbi:MAG: acetylglutamate kinase [Candidatus Methanomethylophilaceae archaeon]|nr:acetylglutamate kinase [Candidatus Methanomethylophilaceae archaeon]